MAARGTSNYTPRSKFIPKDSSLKPISALRQNTDDFTINKSEFPSLGEIVEKNNKGPKCVSENIKTNLKYSDKLKSSQDNWSTKSENKLFSSGGQNPLTNKTLKICDKNAASASNKNKNLTLPDSSELKTPLPNKHKNVPQNPNLPPPTGINCKKAISNSSSGEKKPVLKIVETLQHSPNIPDRDKNPRHKETSCFHPNIHLHAAAIVDELQQRKQLPTHQNSRKVAEIKAPNQMAANVEGKKKKKRKSKMKRQAEKQSTKISFLTPEAHSKILGQSSTVPSGAAPTSYSININDCKEYPELGTTSLSKSTDCTANANESKSLKKASPDTVKEISNDVSFAELSARRVVQVETNEGSVPSVQMQADTEKAVEMDKMAVHTNNPITLSIVDMLHTAKSKKKELVTKVVASNENQVPKQTEKPQTKSITKKAFLQPVNFLDSSGPVIKRGKEREKPKAKKPSKMRKLILIGRQMKKEKIFTGTEGTNVGNVNSIENELLKKETCDETDILTETCCDSNRTFPLNSTGTINEMILKEDSLMISSYFQLQSGCETGTITNRLYLSDDQENGTSSSNLAFEGNLQFGESSPECISVLEEYVADIRWLFQNRSGDVTDAENLSSSHSSVGVNVQIAEESDDVFTQKTTLMNPVTNGEGNTNLISEGNALLNTYGVIAADKTKSSDSPFAEKERVEAVKVLLHTRKFRQYCNHFVTKELGETVSTLLDDLARFQDRLHQKDPIKARVRRRLIYGIREIKKHMKLKKLKSIIIATDIEDIRTDGGLNDVVNEMMTLAEMYHITCIFSHKRFHLGKVCRKGVPVSCVGLFNYEGSEKNFKKAMELQENSTCDYKDLTKWLSSVLSEEEVGNVFKMSQEAPERILDFRVQVLKKYAIDAKKNNCNQKTLPVSENGCKPDESITGCKDDEFHLLKLSSKCSFEMATEDRMCDIIAKYDLV